jgi:CheY-like chemotaxis protein
VHRNVHPEQRFSDVGALLSIGDDPAIANPPERRDGAVTGIGKDSGVLLCRRYLSVPQPILHDDDVGEQPRGVRGAQVVEGHLVLEPGRVYRWYPELRPEVVPRQRGSCRRGEQRVVLVDAIDADPDLTVVGEARNGVEAIARTRDLDRDVVLMDIRMPDLDGIEATRRLVASQARARILVLTTFDMDEYDYRAMSAGETGLLLRVASREQLTSAIRTATFGEAMLAPAVIRRLIEEFCRRPPPDADPPPALSQLSPAQPARA